MRPSPTPAPTPTEAPSASLVTGAVHDLRNVLFVIRAHCERLLTDIDPEDPHAAELHAIQDTAERGVAIARQMIADAQSRERPAKPVDVNDVIRGMLPLVTRLAGSVTVSTTLAGDAWPVAANAVQIEQIVMNLVTNARDAMPHGGGVVLGTENRQACGAEGKTESVVIWVTDTGTGIDPAVQARMFEPHFTTRADSGGTGLGLATVHAIALLHGGHVEVSSALGEGATFRVVLPRAVATDRLEPPRTDMRPAAERLTRVLLIENEHAIRSYLQRCLLSEGYDVQVAASGAEAIHMCGEPHQPVDVVVTDVHLPDIEGPQVAAQLRAHWPEVRVVFMSGGVEALEALSERGAVPVLAKPFTTSELVSAVRAVLPSAGRN